VEVVTEELVELAHAEDLAGKAPSRPDGMGQRIAFP